MSSVTDSPELRTDEEKVTVLIISIDLFTGSRGG